MERKIPFLKKPNHKDGCQLERIVARRIEVLSNELIAVVEGFAFFNAQWSIPKAHAGFSLTIFHFGQPVLKTETGALLFEPQNTSKLFDNNEKIEVGNKSLLVGVSGKSTSRPGCGWLPKYLHLNIGTIGKKK